MHTHRSCGSQLYWMYICNSVYSRIHMLILYTHIHRVDIYVYICLLQTRNSGGDTNREARDC